METKEVTIDRDTDVDSLTANLFVCNIAWNIIYGMKDEDFLRCGWATEEQIAAAHEKVGDHPVFDSHEEYCLWVKDLQEKAR